MNARESSSSQWRTLAANNGERGGQDAQERLSAGHTLNLQDQVTSWPTPDAAVSNDGEQPETFLARQELQKARGINGNGMGTPLAMAAKLWPTPAASEDRLGFQRRPEGMASDQNQQSLTTVAMLWATPSVADTTGGRMTRSGDRSDEPLLKGQASVTTLASILPDPPISLAGEESSAIRRSLNPLFVEWLMGWPPDWTFLALTPPASTGCECSATALSAWKQRMRSALCALGLPPEAPLVQADLFAGASE